MRRQRPFAMRSKVFFQSAVTAFGPSADACKPLSTATYNSEIVQFLPQLTGHLVVA